MKAGGLALGLLRPLRWEAEIFGFRTASLDLRQNTTVINRVLGEIWLKLNPLEKDAPSPARRSGRRGLPANWKSPGLHPAIHEHV